VKNKRAVAIKELTRAGKKLSKFLAEHALVFTINSTAEQELHRIQLFWIEALKHYRLASHIIQKAKRKTVKFQKRNSKK